MEAEQFTKDVSVVTVIYCNCKLALINQIVLSDVMPRKLFEYTD